MSDYPVTVRKQRVDTSHGTSRLKLVPYSAAILNWYALSGSGDTAVEALADLNRNFEKLKADRRTKQEPLPRPGTHVPIEFAATDRVDGHRELADDFVRRVLDIEWAFVSDESSLWDFHDEEANERLVEKVKDVYGVDISDIESGRLCEIFERIAQHERSPG